MQQWMYDLTDSPRSFVPSWTGFVRSLWGWWRSAWTQSGIRSISYRLSGEDLGTQDRPMISPRMFELYVRPRFERLWRHAKRKLLEKNPNGKLMLHSCGNIRPFIPAWIEMGLDILDPIQPRARTWSRMV